MIKHCKLLFIFGVACTPSFSVWGMDFFKINSKKYVGGFGFSFFQKQPQKIPEISSASTRMPQIDEKFYKSPQLPLSAPKKSKFDDCKDLTKETLHPLTAEDRPEALDSVIKFSFQQNGLRKFLNNRTNRFKGFMSVNTERLPFKVSREAPKEEGFTFKLLVGDKKKSVSGFAAKKLDNLLVQLSKQPGKFGQPQKTTLKKKTVFSKSINVAKQCKVEIVRGVQITEEALKKEFETLRTRWKKLEQEKSDLKNEFKEWQNLLALETYQQKVDLERAQETKENLFSDLSNLMNEKKELEKRLSTLKEQLDLATEEGQKTKNQLQLTVAMSQDDLSGERKKNEEQENENKELAEQVNELINFEAKLISNLKHKSNKIKELKICLNNMRNENNKFIYCLEEKYTQLEEKDAQLEEKDAQLKEKYTQLEENNNQLKKTKASLYFSQWLNKNLVFVIVLTLVFWPKITQRLQDYFLQLSAVQYIRSLTLYKYGVPFMGLLLS